jgi:hypothetical protein
MMKFTHPIFKESINNRPESDLSTIVFPWDTEKNEYSTLEWDIANSNHQRLYLNEFDSTMAKVKTA